MNTQSHIELGHSARRLRLDTLIGLRWLAVAGQSIALLLTYYGLGFQFPILSAFLAVAVSAVANILLRLIYPVNKRLDDRSAAMLLGYDIIQLSFLIYLTGGLQNPFAVLFLAPVIISAVSLPAVYTLILMALMIVSGTFLANFHLPLPWFQERPLDLPILYVFGNWIALVLGAGFVAIYATRVAGEARHLADALTATELALAREQHLTQLDGLAAAAAHELGTPLATITLVVKEISGQLAPDSLLYEDINLLSQEVKRCRDILGKLTSLDEGPGSAWDSLRLTHLLDEVASPERDFGVDLTISKTTAESEPLCRRNPGIIYGLGNLVENAVDFARSEVRIVAFWDADVVRIEINDDGPGFAMDVIGRLGEPYVTTRADRKAKTEQAPGLGLGLFVAKTLLERSGAKMAMRNAQAPESGARVIIEWQRVAIEYVPGK
ncbi:MAG: ActS/PrrB/RegB family redox-sensitive histidine kinase [Beijerinckiaceae bacterium]|nr:ActS/PrrB/RegB family redox-sensitive histidine kinase [Beijerinckiaceae bacterium]